MQTENNTLASAVAALHALSTVEVAAAFTSNWRTKVNPEDMSDYDQLATIAEHVGSSKDVKELVDLSVMHDMLSAILAGEKSSELFKRAATGNVMLGVMLGVKYATYLQELAATKEPQVVAVEQE